MELIFFFCRGIGAVVYKVPELKNDQLLKVSLRSIESEDTTVISEVGFVVFFYLLFFLLFE